MSETTTDPTPQDMFRLYCIATVVGADYVTPLMRRITFTSDEFEKLGNLLPAHPLRMYFAPDGSTSAALPERSPDQLEEYYSDYRSDVRVARPYTVRSFDRETLRMDIDFVIHANPGPGSTWAAAAKEGDSVGIGMPPGSEDPTNDVGGETPGLTRMLAGDVDCCVLVGDETAVAHIIPTLEYLEAGTRVVALIEVEDAAEEQEFHTAADADVRWLHRNGSPAGQSGLLERALREMPWPEGTVYVWASAEAKEVGSIRRFLREERGLDRSSYMIIPYWRFGMDFSTRLSQVEQELVKLTSQGLDLQEMLDTMEEGLQ